MKKIMALACLSALLFAGCKKTDTCNLTEESLVGTYRLTALTYRQSPSGTEQDLYNTIYDCERDNVFIFNADRTFNFQDVGILCIPPLNDASTWSLIGTTLEFGGEVNNVTSFDCNNMITTTSDYNFPGDVLRATYIRQ